MDGKREPYQLHALKADTTGFMLSVRELYRLETVGNWRRSEFVRRNMCYRVKHICFVLVSIMESSQRPAASLRKLQRSLAFVDLNPEKTTV